MSAVDLLSDTELVCHYADTARRFERLCAGVERTGRRSFPDSAAEFLGALNLSLRFAAYRLAGD